MLVSESIKKQIQDLKKKYSTREIESLTGVPCSTVWRKLNDVSRIDLDFIMALEKSGLIKIKGK